MRRSLRAYTAQKLSQHATRVMDSQGVPPAVGRDQQDVFLDLMSQVGCWQKVPSTQTASRSHPIISIATSTFLFRPLRSLATLSGQRISGFALSPGAHSRSVLQDIFFGARCK